MGGIKILTWELFIFPIEVNGLKGIEILKKGKTEVLDKKK